MPFRPARSSQMSPLERMHDALLAIVSRFTFAIPKARARLPELRTSRPDAAAVRAAATRLARARACVRLEDNRLLHASHVRQQLFFPDRMLIQFDCGKLQVQRRA